MLPFVLLATVVMTTNALDYSTLCPQGWEYFTADKICMQSFDTPKTFPDARKACQSFGGDLVQIKSNEQKDFVKNLEISFKSWIGLFKKVSDEHFSYVDGSEIGDFNLWVNEEPKVTFDNGGCIVMYGHIYKSSAGKWNNYFCNHKLAYICSIELQGSCLDGWVYIQNQKECVKNFDTPLPYNDARKKCQTEVENGDLVEIKNEAYTNFILNLPNLSMYNWIGVQDANDDQVFHYLDGSGLEDYHPWDEGEPNNWRGTENCGMVYGQGAWIGKWNDANCGDAHPFICSAVNK